MRCRCGSGSAAGLEAVLPRQGTSRPSGLTRFLENERLLAGIPALRERREDIEPLARHFAGVYRDANAKPTLELDQGGRVAQFNKRFGGLSLKKS